MAEQLLTATDSLASHIGEVVLIDVYLTVNRGKSGEFPRVITDIGKLVGTRDIWENTEILSTFLMLDGGKTLVIDWVDPDLDKVEWSVIP
jgi:hypothetical protein